MTSITMCSVVYNVFITLNETFIST